ncbi:chemotaxis protein CheA [Gemmobacter aquarius]|uniref:histidine kinase n=1 Tax=Paragemmobacter aquarius TaxID=2169400 RepID=A0A2S0UPH8_9RHOB|nr:Hpt domain-containing protein [Gemmobacter aquarius]AWB49690.1 chemotaxis protein CheA [Gemmobacter aquarius]
MSDEMDEIWALYADDGAQALDAMETALMALGDGSGGGQDAHVSALFRAVHTFKGNSRVLGLAVVESRAHHSEDLIGLVRDQGVPWDGEIKDILLLAADTLRTMLEETAATRADVDGSSSEMLMTRLLDKIARCSGAEPASAEVVAPPAPVQANPFASTEPEADPQPEPAAEAEAEPQPEPEAAPEPAAPAKKPKSRKTADPAAVAAFLSDPEPPAAPAEAAAPPAKEPAPPAPRARRLADDPTYRDIFKGMSTDTRTKLSALYASYAADPEAAPKARREADGLCHAAKQMGLDDWVEALQTYLSTATEAASAEDLATLLLRLDDLTDATFGAPASDPADTGNFFDGIRGFLSEIASMGTDFSLGDAPSPDRIAAAIATLQAAAAPFGFLRLSESAAALARASTATEYRSAELRLYEELSAVEAVMPEAALAAGISPRELVQSWSAEHVFDTLASLEATLDRLRAPSSNRDKDHALLDHLLRLVHHACAHYRIDTAGQLAMSLIDLFARVQSTGIAPDAILTHIARGFIDTIELVFDALYQGETPDTQNLEKLFEEAANVCFVQDGLMTASAIERRLGLPKEFHRVLSPESVRAASEAIESGQRFYIIRADINTDESLAEAFIVWLSSGLARPITNVTVFQGDDTLFDFLVSTTLDEPSLAEALARLDPGTRKLRALRALTIQQDTPQTEAAPADPENAAMSQMQSGVTPEMLESIGEIAASQSMISHMLGELADHDLMDSIDNILRGNGQDWRRARTQVRTLMADFATRLQEVTQMEAQLVGQLTQLQEETVEIRSRAISSVIRPLETFVQTYSRRNRREAQFSCSGGDLTLDITILETLRKLLRSLFVMRLDLGPDAPQSIHIAFHRDEERVLAIVEDDGAMIDASPVLDEIQSTLSRSGGELRRVAIPGKGMRFHISLPLAMVVLDGMVVGVKGVRYVVPVDAIRMILQPETDVAFTVSAAEGQQMLRIADDEIVAVHSLAARDQTDGESRRVYVVVGAQGRSVAVPVDELIGQQLVLLRPLRGVLSRVQNMTGIALLAGGDVGMVVSANMLCAASREAVRNPSLRM